MNKQEIFKMLREESGTFATEDDDIECAAQLKLEINLRNDNPVQKHTQFNSQALVWRGKDTPAGYDQSWMEKQIEVTSIIPSCVREGKRWQSETMCQLQAVEMQNRGWLPAHPSHPRHPKQPQWRHLLFGARPREALWPRICNRRTLTSHSFHHPLGSIPVETHLV